AKECGHTMRYIPIIGISRSHGPAAARNIGWRAACGEIIAFTDDDCIPASGWLKAGCAAFVDGIAAVSGRIIVPRSDTPTDYEYNVAYLEHSKFITANSFYQRSALLSVGGFDERFTVSWREDSDLFFTLLKQNNKYTFAPEATVIHPVRPAPWGISLRQQRKSMFNALLYKKHRDLYWQKIQPSPPWHYYSIMVALLALCISIWKRAKLTALSSLFIWIYLTGQFCLQRLRHTSHTPGHVVEMIVTSILIPPLAIFWRITGMIKFRVLFLCILTSPWCRSLKDGKRS
ncbi:MAG: glycosyltransferase, partial [Chloroflexota bacterium]|nr:glycosyltransferase [Chloroflexota bacterium]